MRESTRMRWSARLVMIVACVAVLFPMLWVVRMALKTDQGFLADPPGIGGTFTLDNFANAWTGVDLGGAIRDSLAITLPGAAIATILGVLAGYAFAKLAVPGRRLLIAIAVGGLTIPIAALVIPQFDQALQLRNLFGFSYVDSFWGLASSTARSSRAGAACSSSATSGTCRATCWRRPRSMARPSIQSFRRIALPLAGPAIAVGFVLNVFLQWSEVLLGLIMLPGGDTRTAMTAIASFSTQFRVGGPLTAAAAIIVALPIFVLFLVAQRWLKTEIFGGSIKG